VEAAGLFQRYYYTRHHCLRLIVIFKASVTRLIPICDRCFLSFTLSQAYGTPLVEDRHLKQGEEVVEPGSTLRYSRAGVLRVCQWFARCVQRRNARFAVTKFKRRMVVLILTPCW